MSYGITWGITKLSSVLSPFTVDQLAAVFIFALRIALIAADFRQVLFKLRLCD